MVQKQITESLNMWQQGVGQWKRDLRGYPNQSVVITVRILRSGFCVQILVLPLVTCVCSAGDKFSGLQNPHLKSGDNSTL